MITLFKIFKKKFKPRAKLEKKLISILGFTPKNISLYKEALTHKSIRDRSTHNERLEFLGDAIFGSVVAEYVFKEFPLENEGFLTQTRAKIVSRKTLNHLATKLNLDAVLKHQVNSNRSIFGNALEALIGAIFLDKGYEFTSKYIINSLIHPHLEITRLIEETSSYKSSLLEWGQAHKKEVIFKTVSSSGKDHEKTYEVLVEIEGKKHGVALGTSIKRAEESAAKQTLKELIKS
tara:strand:- start:29356 stop:30057 length:702 start_codon:yes stop_codon:yes gene_type:complete